MNGENPEDLEHTSSCSVEQGSHEEGGTMKGSHEEAIVPSSTQPTDLWIDPSFYGSTPASGLI